MTPALKPIYLTVNYRQDKYYPQTIRKTPEEYLSLAKKKLGRRDTLFKKIVQYSGECRADVQIIAYENNRYFTLYTNGGPPPSAEQLVRLQAPIKFLPLTGSRKTIILYRFTTRLAISSKKRRCKVHPQRYYYLTLECMVLLFLSLIELFPQYSLRIIGTAI